MNGLPRSTLAPAELADALGAVRTRLDALAATLRDGDWFGPYAETLNPPLWEYGHIVWFQEHWCLRQRPGRDPGESPLVEPLAPSRMAWADWRYNSSRIPHAARWQAPFPSAGETRAWGRDVLGAVQENLHTADGGDTLRYFAELSLHHESMHVEAWWMMWQWRGLAPPAYPAFPALAACEQLAFAPGRITLGAGSDAGFSFDNERKAHPVDLPAFEIDSRPVTGGEFCEFIDAGGYTNAALWSEAGRAWLADSGARHPLYWEHRDGTWQVRRFDRWMPLDAHEAVRHVSRYEAEAYAHWRGRHLPGAVQWLQASRAPGFARGGCWEWTADAFLPYPGFRADPYADYSLPWFGTHAEVRGAGSVFTDASLARADFRNFYLPHRRDPFIGFRTARAMERV